MTKFWGLRPIVDPEVDKIEHSGMRDETVTRHPAFAQIVHTRGYGSASHLYGSDFGHNASITLRICHSELHRSLSGDRYYGREGIVEIEMSESQWATFISAPGCGDGVPCTLRQKGSEMIAALPPPPTRHEQFGEEMQDMLGEIDSRLREIEEKIDGLGISKKKGDELKMDLGVARQHLKANTKFVAKQFDEHMEKTTEKAKQEIHGYINGVVHRAGLQALQAPISMPAALEHHGDRGEE